MQKLIIKIGIVIIVLIVGIQFIHTEKNASTTPSKNDISQQYLVSPAVERILEKACNDCHSNHTQYPWYNHFQPVAWWLSGHIQNGKRHLNFNEFTNMRVARQYKRLNDCIETVKENEMPLQSYTWIHKEAILSDAEKDTLFSWCNTVRDAIKARYPADSLVMPKKKKK